MEIIGFRVNKKGLTREINIDVTKAGKVVLCSAIPLLLSIPAPIEPAVECSTTIAPRLQPIVEAIRSCAKPIAYGSFCWGWCKVMLGQKSEGLKQIHSAAWGFAGIQLVPTLIEFIAGLGDI